MHWFLIKKTGAQEVCGSDRRKEDNLTQSSQREPRDFLRVNAVIFNEILKDRHSRDRRKEEGGVNGLYDNMICMR